MSCEVPSLIVLIRTYPKEKAATHRLFTYAYKGGNIGAERTGNALLTHARVFNALSALNLEISTHTRALVRTHVTLCYRYNSLQIPLSPPLNRLRFMRLRFFHLSAGAGWGRKSHCFQTCCLRYRLFPLKTLRHCQRRECMY